MRICVFLLCSIIIFGCSSAVSIGHYSIEYVPVGEKPTEILVNENIGIENFTSTSAIRRHEIIMRQDNSNKLEYSATNFWWELPQEIVTETFKNYLENQNLFANILSYPTLGNIKYILKGKIHKFEIVNLGDEWASLAAIEIYLISAESQEILWKSGQITQMTKCENNMNSAANSMEKNLPQIYQKIYQNLKKQILQK